MKIYILTAKGPLLDFSGVGQITSRKAYANKELAEKNSDNFLEKCGRNGGETLSLTDLDIDNSTVIISELELITE